MTSAAVLCIGTELTRGELVNTNAAWLAERLTALGLEVTAIDCVDDHAGRIVAALRRLGAEHAALVCTGGLGPTTDDITSEAVAAALGVPLERDADAFQAVRDRMERFGRKMAASNAKQADFPRSSVVLKNDWGTAPGFSIRVERALAFFLPGVPREMHAMFDAHVAPRLRELSGASSERIVQILLRSFGMTESAVNDALSGVEANHGVTLGYRAHFPEIEVKVLARGDDASEIAARARRAADDVRSRLGSIVYGEGDTTLAEQVGRLLVQRGWLLGAAESCTGGLLSELITERSGSSAFFGGAVVSYENSVKQRLLGVSESLLASEGAVSEAVARAMAEGACRALGVPIAVSITGIAGPTGGTPEKPVGLVHFAVHTLDGSTARNISYPGSRAQVRRLSAFAALALCRKVLLEGHD